MALVDNTTYTGKDALGFYSTALLTGDTKSLIKVVPNVKSKIKMASLDLGNILQSADCTFSDSGVSTLGQKTLEVCPLKINLEFCEKTFETNYLSEQLRAGSNAGQIPATFSEYILTQIAAKTSEQLENLLWQGDSNGSPASLCDGFLVKFAADAAVIDVSGTTLSASNILAEVAKVYAAIPNTIANRGKVVIFISPAAAKFYKQAMVASFPALNAANAGDFNLSYIDVPLVIAPGMPTNKMVAAEPDNLWYGTDLESDVEDIMIIPMKNTLGQPTVRFVAETKFGVEYGVGAEIVYYA